MGFKTTSSCGGHPEREKLPYIDFPSSQLEKVISLMEAWRKAGGGEYIIIPSGEFLESIRIRPLSSSIMKAQDDLDKFIDFLNEKTGGLSDRKISLAELMQRIRREINKELPLINSKDRLTSKRT